MTMTDEHRNGHPPGAAPTGCAQLRQEEGLNVLVVPVHGLAQLHEVGEHRLLGPLTRHLGRLQRGPAPLACQLRVVLLQNAKHAV